MATNARSSADHEFVIGNRAQELFVAVIGICDPRKDKSHFPAYCRKLVLAMDEHFRRHLKSAGFELKIESYRKNNKIKERVTICREHSAS